LGTPFAQLDHGQRHHELESVSVMGNSFRLREVIYRVSADHEAHNPNVDPDMLALLDRSGANLPH
jgi:hypothetical protein